MAAVRLCSAGRKMLVGQNEFPGDEMMQDVLWIAVSVAFFAMSIAYVHFCERVK
jgi:hypothetical protein